MRILATLALASLLGGCRTEGKPTPTVLTPGSPVADEGIVLAERSRRFRRADLAERLLRAGKL